MKLVRLSSAWLSLLTSGRKTKKYCVSCGNILYAIGNVPQGRLNKSMNGMDVVVNMLVWGCCVDCRLHGIISIHIIIIVDIAENVYSCYNRGRITENTTKECKFVIIKAHKYLSILQ